MTDSGNSGKVPLRLELGYWTLVIDWDLGLGHWKFSREAIEIFRLGWRILSSRYKTYPVEGNIAAQNGITQTQSKVERNAVANA